jgi:hypothetical protein
MTSMSSTQNAARRTRLGLTVVLLAVAFDATAQAEQLPPHLLGFSSSLVYALQHEREKDVQGFDTRNGTRGANGFLTPRSPQMWTLYGGLGFLSFHNRLEHDSGGVRLKLGRSGPRLTGKLYLGIHRRY